MPSLHFSISDCVSSTPILFPHSCFTVQSVSHICISSSRIGRLQQLLSTSDKGYPLVISCLKPNELKNRRPRFGNHWKEPEKQNQNDFFVQRSERQIELKSGRSDADSDFFDLREETGVEKLKDSDERIRQKKEINNKGNIRRQLMNRSKMLAKQVISSRSALSLGFISQLWVDTNSWLVVVIEVRPSLLSGESERFLLDDVSQVGDVVLVPDESVMENEMKMIGLETLVGYDVVTEGQRNMGKVRGYTFDINTGAIESLELDSFGISIIPSTLVSTYSLFVEDVVEVEPDMVVVHESAASRIQRLTKGLWDTHLMGNSINDPIKDSDIESTTELDQKRNRKPTKLRKKWIDALDGLELPMDFL
ncbi:uncharacterized protein LOC124926414 [Impatiens glandulifera]|uniref:uncharacterized protein LOC124926414 n=1 Tax=Impatiens glandulifera TaxID=253017 RepID=UPI001FB08801|nr:uncharacterized protein LOC124926414 [Impatiens glandulifera]